MAEEAKTPWLSMEEQQLLLDFLTRYFQELKVQSPKAEALELFQMLEDEDRRLEAVRQITRCCDRSTAWIGWTHRVNKIRQMLAYKLAKEGHGGPAFNFVRFGLPRPSELVSDAEKELWELYLEGQKLAWEIPAERIAEPALAALDAFCEQSAAGTCSLTLAEFLGLYDPKEGRI